MSPTRAQRQPGILPAFQPFLQFSQQARECSSQALESQHRGDSDAERGGLGREDNRKPRGHSHRALTPCPSWQESRCPEAWRDFAHCAPRSVESANTN